ncbi:hypothetical protein [Nocardia sp. NPDC004260]
MKHLPTQSSAFNNAAAGLRDARLGGITEAIGWLAREWESEPIPDADDVRDAALQKIAEAAVLLNQAEAELEGVIRRYRK